MEPEKPEKQENKKNQMNDIRLASIERQLNKIFALLDGPSGMVTKLELQRQQLKDIPSPSNLRWYAFVGGGVVTFFGFIGWSILQVFKKGGI